ncbi:hypothetical protein GPECTOR_16g596 [Gonium pectorale]|uniref:Uncharacterized protein n=1 Tax=Gonium pectorale TaxID=33097 RepID=A0A150GKT5_GONPE|nr:hypothetical protein GPECTOR_16g596 [Gonium pectorale]|eukprot:KXZ50422.1 hypothetical protein GPECTOR_16g596 [Gonium pectorale]
MPALLPFTGGAPATGACVSGNVAPGFALLYHVVPLPSGPQAELAPAPGSGSLELTRAEGEGASGGKGLSSLWYEWSAAGHGADEPRAAPWAADCGGGAATGTVAAMDIDAVTWGDEPAAALPSSAGLAATAAARSAFNAGPPPAAAANCGDDDARLMASIRFVSEPSRHPAWSSGGSVVWEDMFGRTGTAAATAAATPGSGGSRGRGRSADASAPRSSKADASAAAAAVMAALGTWRGRCSSDWREGCEEVWEVAFGPAAGSGDGGGGGGSGGR